MSKLFQNRTLKDYLEFAALLILLVADILYILLDAGDKTYSMTAFFLVLAGTCLGLMLLALRINDFMIVPALMLAAAAGIQTYISLPTISDIWNHVVYIGGNQTNAVLFLALFIGGTLALTIAGFFPEKERK